MVVFQNPGEIDARSISSFGVSVKESENPIGFFGTGLKYAIAVLLRTGHQVTVLAGRSVIRFGLQRESIRGKDFDFVTMAVDGAAAAPLGFTTELGKQWEVWMAYRELACNCKDEGGVATVRREMPLSLPGFTSVVVEGAEFQAVHGDRHLFLLEDEPWLTVGDVEIRRRAGDQFFYRGVRVHTFGIPGVFTYNSNGRHELTEDRTLKDQWSASQAIRKAILRSDDADFIRACITAPERSLEGEMDFHGWGIQPSETFVRVTGDCLSDRALKVNATAAKVWQDCTKKSFAPREIATTAVQQRSLERALDFCARIGFQIRGAYPIKVVESLGSGGLGMAADGTIFIAERAFQMGGTKQVASTLIEEYVHLRHELRDETRELQNLLFEKLVSVGEELVGEPL